MSSDWADYEVCVAGAEDEAVDCGELLDSVGCYAVCAESADSVA